MCVLYVQGKCVPFTFRGIMTVGLFCGSSCKTTHEKKDTYNQEMFYPEMLYYKMLDEKRGVT